MGHNKVLDEKPSTIGDLSAVVTGILLAMTLPADMPWWIVLIGALVSIGVAKMTFGGIAEHFQPAIVGRVFCSSVSRPNDHLARSERFYQKCRCVQRRHSPSTSATAWMQTRQMLS